jgi:hypothetical protein
MGWIRANLKLGSWCALFALAVQLSLSFGHFHRNGTESGSISPPLSASSPGYAVVEHIDGGSGPSSPTRPEADYCSICAVLNLAGSAVPAATPAAPLPAVDYRALAFAIAETSLTPPVPPNAQARAPPQT